ncbi:uncharacterized protein LOC144113807 [Amblyomma americanum]
MSADFDHNPYEDPTGLMRASQETLQTGRPPPVICATAPSGPRPQVKYLKTRHLWPGSATRGKTYRKYKSNMILSESPKIAGTYPAEVPPETNVSIRGENMGLDHSNLVAVHGGPAPKAPRIGPTPHAETTARSLPPIAASCISEDECFGSRDRLLIASREQRGTGKRSALSHLLNAKRYRYNSTKVPLTGTGASAQATPDIPAPVAASAVRDCLPASNMCCSAASPAKQRAAAKRSAILRLFSGAKGTYSVHGGPPPKAPRIGPTPHAETTARSLPPIAASCISEDESLGRRDRQLIASREQRGTGKRSALPHLLNAKKYRYNSTKVPLTGTGASAQATPDIPAPVAASAVRDCLPASNMCCSAASPAKQRAAAKRSAILRLFSGAKGTYSVHGGPPPKAPRIGPTPHAETTARSLPPIAASCISEDESLGRRDRQLIASREQRGTGKRSALPHLLNAKKYRYNSTKVPLTGTGASAQSTPYIPAPVAASADRDCLPASNMYCSAASPAKQRAAAKRSAILRLFNGAKGTYSVHGGPPPKAPRIGPTPHAETTARSLPPIAASCISEDESFGRRDRQLIASREQRGTGKRSALSHLLNATSYRYNPTKVPLTGKAASAPAAPDSPAPVAASAVRDCLPASNMGCPAGSPAKQRAAAARSAILRLFSGTKGTFSVHGGPAPKAPRIGPTPHAETTARSLPPIAASCISENQCLGRRNRQLIASREQRGTGKRSALSHLLNAKRYRYNSTKVPLTGTGASAQATPDIPAPVAASAVRDCLPASNMCCSAASPGKQRAAATRSAILRLFSGAKGTYSVHGGPAPKAPRIGPTPHAETTARSLPPIAASCISENQCLGRRNRQLIASREQRGTGKRSALSHLLNAKRYRYSES